ncbi:NUDIX domain-containing protein [Kitasatospora sp. NPDC004272]
MTDTTNTPTDETTQSGHKKAETIRYTADVVAVRPDGRVLLIERGHAPYAGLLALPGGHVDSGETAREAAVRELHEETGVLVDPDDLVLLGVYDEPGRDPRGRYVGAAYLARVPAGTEARAGDDAASVHWVPLDALPEQLAFDHHLVLADARRFLSGH